MQNNKNLQQQQKVRTWQANIDNNKRNDNKMSVFHI